MNKPSEHLPDSWVLGAYRRLGRPEPAVDIDDTILERARMAIGGDHRVSPAWVWPMSMAAALVICLGLFFQIANLMPRPTVVVMEPPAIAVERYSPPPVGTEARMDRQHGVLSDSRTGGDHMPLRPELMQDRRTLEGPAPGDDPDEDQSATRQSALADNREGRERPLARDGGPRTAADWRRRLEQAMEDDDVEAFRDALEAIHERNVDVELSPELREWALHHGLHGLIK